MPIRPIEALLGSPPERDRLAVQLFEKDGDQWGEVFVNSGQLIIEFWGRRSGDPWQFGVDDLLDVLVKTKARLECPSPAPRDDLDERELP